MIWTDNRAAYICWLVISTITALVFVVLLATTRLSINPLIIQPTHGFDVSKAFVIALKESEGERVAEEVRKYLRIHDVTIKTPVNGTAAVESMKSDPSQLSLYSRHILRTGRDDHMHIGNSAMLSCLLSHLEIWEYDMRDEPIIAVFEEDAILDEASGARLAQLSRDLYAVDWDMLLLERGHLNTEGAWQYTGELAATCAEDGTCLRYGTRGYLVKNSAAKLLAAHARPFVVQVDSLISLLAADQPWRFRLFWSTSDVAYPSPWRMSTLWDGCLRCFMPHWALSTYALMLFLFIVTSRIQQLSGFSFLSTTKSGCVDPSK